MTGFRLLHVGCGAKTHADLAPPFNQPPWQEFRLDIDPAVEPDIIASITDMPGVATSSFDCVWSSHNIEHLYPHDVPRALVEFVRVLTPAGFAVVTVPDLAAAARSVAEGGLLETAYLSPAGPVAPIDILFGFRPALAAGNHFMAHRTGFTQDSLGQALRDAGFVSVAVTTDGHWNLWAVASLATADQAATGALADMLAGRRDHDPARNPSDLQR